jgi:transketolase
LADTKPTPEQESIFINTVRFLAADMVQKANSGHPGMPMGAAAMAYTLWTRVLRHNPANPRWANRDRFVLSAGHGSALLYALLHLTGYDLPLDELKHFRQWGSRTPGHPEFGLTPGVEATTGPLGQGISNAVGMAIAEANLAARFNRPGFPLVAHHTYVIAGDGDLSEGISSEASSLAGHLKLGRLIVLYDDNRILLSGSTALSFSEDVTARYEAYGWRTFVVEDGNDTAAVEWALNEARGQEQKPSLIRVHTHIGFGAPHKQDTSEAHGSPLGPEELRAAKEKLGWPVEPMFLIPPEALVFYRKAVPLGAQQEKEWDGLLDRYQKQFSQEAGEFRRRMAGTLPEKWEDQLPSFSPADGSPATRKASETILQKMGAALPELIGGSADLSPSTFAWLKKEGNFESPDGGQGKVEGAAEGGWNYSGRTINFGVREHAMGAICNGLALHGGFIPFGGTFLVFSDYMRGAVRVGALSRLQTVWVFSHDSIFLGEDGPTHQPVEHLAALRAIPNMVVLRPADANETVEAWRIALTRKTGPTALILTRQGVPVLDQKDNHSAQGTRSGAYVLWEPQGGTPRAILMASGSEVQLVLQAGKQLNLEGIPVRVVSFPSWELFAAQDGAYRQSVFPAEIPLRLAVEAGIRQGWERWIGDRGEMISIDRFGASAPMAVLQEKFGFTVEAVVKRTKDLLASRSA